MPDSMDDQLDRLYVKSKEAREQDRDAAAAELLAAYLRHRPDHGWAWYLYGDALRQIGLRLEAERALSRSVELLDNPFYPSVRLGQLYRAFGEYSEAERWLSRATELPDCSENGWVWIVRGANLARMNQLVAAESCHRRALSLPNADYDEAHLNIGLIARAQGRYAEAIDAFKAALTTTPDYPEAIAPLESLAGIFEAIKLAAETPPPSKDRE